MRALLRFLIAALFCLGDVYALDLTPAYTFNQSPLVQIFGLPALGSARVLTNGHTVFDYTYEVANHFTDGASAREQLTLDGETHRSTFALRHGEHGFEWGLELPYVSVNGGYLDGFIETWHDTFGLPDGGRDRVARGQLQFNHQRDGVQRVSVTQASAGPGDLRLTGALSLTPSDATGTDIALRASAKLPTGDSDRLTGSGAPDIAVWLSAACGRGSCSGSWGWYGGAGVVVLGKGNVLPELQRDFALFGVVGLGWQPFGPVTLKGALSGHSAFYDSELKQLGAAGQLLLGGTVALTRDTALDIAVTEDIVVNTAADVSIIVSLRRQY